MEYIRAKGIYYPNELRSIRKSSEMLQPIYEAFTNAWEAIYERFGSENFQHGKITISFYLNSSMFEGEDAVYELSHIKVQTPSGIGLVVEETQKVQLSSQEFDMYYVPEVPESYLVHFPNVAELMTAYIGDQLSDEQINQITFGYGLGERIMQPWWLSVDGGDNSLVPTGDNYFPDDVYAFFTNLRDGEYDNPKYAYQDWLCDYVISYSEPIKKDYQSGIWGYYSNMSIGCWLPSSVTQAPFAMLSAVNMKRSYSQMLSDVGMFLCGPVNLNPEDTGIVITVNLNIYPDSETNTCITTNKVVYTIPAISE